MSTQVTIQARGKKLDLLGSDVLECLKGNKDVVIAFGAATPEDRILKAMHAVVGKYEVQLEIRHAELREYLTHGMAGAVVGAGVAATGLALAALKAGATIISGPAALAIIGIGALVGGIVGTASTPISRVVVYKYRGETRVKFINGEKA